MTNGDYIQPNDDLARTAALTAEEELAWRLCKCAGYDPDTMVFDEAVAQIGTPEGIVSQAPAHLKPLWKCYLPMARKACCKGTPA